MELAREEGSEPESLYAGYPESMEPYLHWYMEAFLRLSKSRGTTMAGVWYIPLSEILAMCRMFRLGVEETERFIDYIQVLDEEYVNDVNSKEGDSKGKPQESGDKFINR